MIEKFIKNYYKKFYNFQNSIKNYYKKFNNFQNSIHAVSFVCL